MSFPANSEFLIHFNGEREGLEPSTDWLKCPLYPRRQALILLELRLPVLPVVYSLVRRTCSICDAAHAGRSQGADQQTDRNDARGIAQMMRAGLYRPVHVKTLRSQKLRMLLTHRKLLQSKAIAIENDLRGTLRNFGLKVGIVGKLKFETHQRAGRHLPDLAVLVEPLLVVCRVLREQIAVLHRRLLVIVRDDDVCRRLMTVPGVGPVVALTFRATLDVPARFRNSRAVGAALGLTPGKYQSGESDHTGGISRCGDEMMRVMLYEAQVMLMPMVFVSGLRPEFSGPAECSTDVT